MADITISRNELATAHADLAGQFERELRDALGPLPGAGFDVQVLVDVYEDGALERAWIVLTRPEGVREFPISLPVAEGDVHRATERSLAEGRSQDRRQGARARLNRRT